MTLRFLIRANSSMNVLFTDMKKDNKRSMVRER